MVRGQHRLTWREFGCAFLILTIALAVVFLPALRRQTFGYKVYGCQVNLKQFGLVFQMYARESPGGLYPQ